MWTESIGGAFLWWNVSLKPRTDKGAPSLAGVAEQTGRTQASVQWQEWHTGVQPTASFYFSVDGACLLNRFLRSSAGSQVHCPSVVTCGVSGGKSFSLHKCIQLDTPCSLTAVGVPKITL